MNTVNRVNCKACNRTHFGLWTRDSETVECPIEGVAVWIATGKVVEDLLPEPQPVPEPPQEPEKEQTKPESQEEQPEPEKKPAAKKVTRRTRKTAKK